MTEDSDGDSTALSVRSVKGIAHNATKNGRVSRDAAITVALQEERRIQEKFRLAELIAERAGRKTVKEEDVRVVEEILDSDL